MSNNAERLTKAALQDQDTTLFPARLLLVHLGAGALAPVLAWRTAAAEPAV